MNGSGKKTKSLKVRTPFLIGLTALALLIGVLGVWSVEARIAGAVIASGKIEVESNRQVLQHPQGGVVGELLVKDGDVVDAGDVVLRFDDTLLRSDLAIIEGQLFEVLARVARLEAERDGLAEVEISGALAARAQVDASVEALIEGQVRLFQARVDSMQQRSKLIAEQIAQAENQIEGFTAQLAAFERQSALIEAELVDSQTLFDKGLASASRVSSLEREKARLLGEIGSMTSGIAQLRGQIAALNIERIGLTTQRREGAITTLRDLQVQEGQLVQQQQSAIDTLSRMELRTPVSGIVYGSTVFGLKSVVSPAAPVMYVIPQDQPLIISARVDPIHVDQVQVGQPATLRFASLDQRLTPEVMGYVTKVSADVFTDQTTGLNHYVAELIPAEGEIGKLGDQPLLPGMPVDAFIKTGDRSPLSYLVKPLADYFIRAFRDG